MFEYAIASGLHDQNPAALIGKALKPMPPKGKQPALLEISTLQQILMDADASGAHPVTRLALRLLALTAVRPGGLRGNGPSLKTPRAHPPSGVSQLSG